MASAHPVFRLLMDHPELLAEHASAYGQLLQDELQVSYASWRQRARLQLLAGAALWAAFLLAGQAVLWWAALHDHLWEALLGVPLLPLLLGAWAAWSAAAASPPKQPPWAELRQQLLADLALIRSTTPPP
jgi:hypothetical protein